MKILRWPRAISFKRRTNVWQPSSLIGRDSTHLPENFHVAHQLCFTLHDILVELLASGEVSKIFHGTFEFRNDADRELLNSLGDIFAWFDKTDREAERAKVFVSAVFPAVLSDMLHCIYEALESSRKGKLNVTFMLLRKMLQESLFLLEAIVIDKAEFANTLATEPVKLYSQTAGGIEVHARRIRAVLEILGEEERFDSSYLAQLRYDKSAEDGFDGICNLAMHLFTGHRSIKTKPMNVNFVFSNYESKLTQWAFLYSRLPYLLTYTRSLIEFICASIRPTDPTYMQDVDRRVLALTMLWWPTVDSRYRCYQLKVFATASRERLTKNCNQAGYREQNYTDLTRMADTGAFPGEKLRSVMARQRGFARSAPNDE